MEIPLEYRKIFGRMLYPKQNYFDNKHQIFEEIKKKFSEQEFHYFCSLAEQIFKFHPDQRISLEGLQQHPFFKNLKHVKKVEDDQFIQKKVQEIILNKSLFVVSHSGGIQSFCDDTVEFNDFTPYEICKGHSFAVMLRESAKRNHLVLSRNVFLQQVEQYYLLNNNR